MMRCPICNALLIFPRGSYGYCEECGYPDEDFSEVYYYPKAGERLDGYQPGLEFYNEKIGKWVTSGVVTKTMHRDDVGFYRVKQETPND